MRYHCATSANAPDASTWAAVRCWSRLAQAKTPTKTLRR